MTLLNTIIANVKQHPFTSGMISSATTTGVSIISILSDEKTVRFIGSIGGLLGIILTLLSIYHKIRREGKR